MLLPTLLVTLGAAVIAILFYRTNQYLSIYIRPCLLKRYKHSTEKKGHAFALVTGSTDGLGRAYAMELAARGFSLILHGRSPEKLAAVKAKILDEHPDTEVRTFLYDAKNTIPFAQTALQEIIKDCNLTVLINNVAVGYEAIGKEEINHHLYVNIHFTTHLTDFLLPTLIANEPALILNTGSDGDMGMPWINVYSGSKAYLMTWGQGLGMTMAEEGHKIEVLGLRIARFIGGENADMQPDWMTPTAENMAKMCLNRVGCGERVVSASLVQGLVRGVVEMLPARTRERIFADQLREKRKGWDKKNM